MLLNLLTVVLVGLVAAYLGNQGVLSALLSFIAAVFGSILAGALFEPLQGLIGGYRQDYARGFTFLILFLLAFGVCRFAADFAVPKNIKLPKIINKTVGGLFGLLTGLVIIGSILIGIQMLPFGTSIFGYDRFSGDNGMQGEGPAAVATGSNIWLAPDRFTLAFWNLASGRSLGGDHSFASVHPDLLTESYGYRNTVQAGVTQTLPPDLMKVNSTWVSTEATVLKAFNMVDSQGSPTGKAVVVRAEITSSGEAPKISVNAASNGAFFFVTPSEVRLVTSQGRQYYPVGYLEKGRSFTPTPLDSGQVADDFPVSKNTVIEDWVFQINSDETPRIFEIKQLVRVAITETTDKFVSVTSTLYPPRAYRQDQGSIHVATNGFEGARIEWFKVYVIRRDSTTGNVKSLYHPVYPNIVDALQQINGSAGTWYTSAGKPGVPGAGDLNTAHRVIQDFENKPNDSSIAWDEVVPYLFVGKSTTDGTHNLIELPKYFDETLVPYFTPSILLKHGIIDSGGTLDLTDLPKGSLDLIAAAKTDKGFYIWALNKEIVPRTQTDVNLTPTNAGYAAVIK